MATDMLSGCFIRAFRCCCSGCSGAAVPVLCGGRFIQAFDLLGVRVSSVRVNRGEGVESALPTDIAIGSPPSEKMTKGEMPT